MISCERHSAPSAVLIKADEILARADRAHKRHQFTRAFDQYGRAISLLQAQWQTTHDAETGKRLAFALREGSYPAFRKFYGRSTADREDWGRCGLERARLACELEVEMLCRGILRTSDEKFHVIIQLQVLCAEMVKQGCYDEGFRYISKTYDTWRRFGDTEPLDPRLYGVLKYHEARCYVHMRAYHHALMCVDEALRLGGFVLDLLAAAQLLREQILSLLPSCT